MSRCISRQGRVAWVARITKQDGKGVGWRGISYLYKYSLPQCFTGPLFDGRRWCGRFLSSILISYFLSFLYIVYRVFPKRTFVTLPSRRGRWGQKRKNIQSSRHQSFFFARRWKNNHLVSLYCELTYSF